MSGQQTEVTSKVNKVWLLFSPKIQLRKDCKQSEGLPDVGIAFSVHTLAPEDTRRRNIPTFRRHKRQKLRRNSAFAGMFQICYLSYLWFN